MDIDDIDDDDEDNAPGILVYFQTGTTSEQMEEIATSLGYSIAAVITDHARSIAVPQGQETEAVRQFAEVPEVEEAQLNEVIWQT